MGSLQALEAIKLILGSEHSIAGRFISVDFLSLETQAMELPRREDCAVCGDAPTITELVQAEESCSL
jgi:molybdopterin/thiamine biosynthesis adenylyltransferase